jgi:DNA-binding transcriptional LysR family regulator
MNNTTLQDAETFLKVIDVGGFAAAARELGVAQSTVSRRVSELEQRLGRRLLERTTRRLLLTEAGERYGEAVRTLLGGLADAEAALNDDGSSATGPLRITVSSGYGRARVLPALAIFAERYPGILFDVDLSDRYVDLLSEAYDFAVRFTEPSTSGLQTKAVGRVHRMLCASPAFLAANAIRAPADLVSERCLVQRTYAPRTVWSVRYRDSMHQVHIRPRMTLNNIEAIRDMTLAGMGVGALPDFLIEEDLRRGRLQTLAPAMSLGSARVYLVWPRHKGGIRRIQALRDHLEAGLFAQTAPQTQHGPPF